MGLYDRDYTQDSYGERYHYPPQMRFGFSRITPAVRWILIINCIVFLFTVISPFFDKLAIELFSVFPKTVFKTMQIWRLITYQFLHDTTTLWHILINMLWLIFFGPLLEGLWGSRKFIVFYLICGAAGGFFYPFLVLMGWLPIGTLIGASGAVLGTLAACAIIFPSMRVYFWGIFPIPIILLAAIFAGISILTLLRPEKSANAGGEAAHLAGMAAGAAYVLSGPVLSRLKFRIRSARWRRKMASREKLMMEADRILQKVHESGINSLTRREKKILKEATESEQVKDGF